MGKRGVHRGIILLGILIGISFLLLNSAGKKNEGFNLVFINVLGLRARDLSVYGSPYNTTPFLKELAKESIVFENAFAQSFLTFPSYISMITSLYPGCSGTEVYDRDSLNKANPTLPELLQANGYYTIWAGNLPNSDPYTNEASGRGITSYYPNWNPVKELLPELRGKKIALFLHTSLPHDPHNPSKQAYQQIWGADSDDPLRELNPERQQDKSYRKWFQNDTFVRELINEEEYLKYKTYDWASMTEEHFWQRYDSFVKSELEEKDKFEYVLSQTSFREARAYYHHTFNLSDPTNVARLHGLYLGEIAEVDAIIQEFLQVLELHKLLDSTIIVITSVHGWEFLEHGKIHAIQLNDETLHVPLIIRIPGLKARRLHEIIENLDITPTILGALNIKGSSTMQGNNLYPYLKQNCQLPRKRAFSELAEDRTLRSEAFRCVTPETQLMRIVNGDDLNENLIAEFPAIAEEMKEALEQQVEINNKCLFKQTSKWPDYIDDETRGRIINSGYW